METSESSDLDESLAVVARCPERVEVVGALVLLLADDQRELEHREAAFVRREGGDGDSNLGRLDALA